MTMANKPASKTAGNKPAVREVEGELETGAGKAIAKAGSDQFPEYIKQNGNRGNENVGTNHITIPRLELAQALSKCLKQGDPNFIEGAAQGHLYNSLTRQLFGKSAIIVPIYFKVEFLIWKDRKKGGGFRGAHSTEADALRARKLLDDGADCEVQETHQQFVVVVVDGKPTELVISHSRTKLKQSKNFNSLIRMNGGDRFSRSYRLSSAGETNDRNEDYWNFQYANHGFPTKEVYEYAEHLYMLIEQGKADVDRTFEGEEVEEGGDRGGEM